jgi:hypothetical protein
MCDFQLRRARALLCRHQVDEKKKKAGLFVSQPTQHYSQCLLFLFFFAFCLHGAA